MSGPETDNPNGSDPQKEITMAEEQAQNADTGSEAVAQPVIPGTTFLTPDAAAKGFEEMKNLVDRQGNELGQTRKQLDQATNLLERSMGQQQAPAKAEAPAGPDFKAELSAIEVKMNALDVDDPGYQKTLNKLVDAKVDIKSDQKAFQLEQKLTGKFEEVRNQDQAQMQSQQSLAAWKQANPDFETPEMQQAIQGYMSQNHKIDMDPILAYREIQQQQLLEQLKGMTAENEDYKNRLSLKAGEKEVGTVVTKTGGQSGATKPTKGITGEALNTGMSEAFRNAT